MLSFLEKGKRGELQQYIYPTKPKLLLLQTILLIYPRGKHIPTELTIWYLQLQTYEMIF